MTVCIAAECQNTASGEAKIIMCSDGKVSSALGSAEVKLKQRVLSGS